jgi:hypothetical protein
MHLHLRGGMHNFGPRGLLSKTSSTISIFMLKGILGLESAIETRNQIRVSMCRLLIYYVTSDRSLTPT